MKHEFRLADIGEGLEEAEIITWLVAVGDHVARDQPLIEVMTDKSNAELPAPEAGIVIELGGDVGDMIAVGELIAVIEQAHAPDAPPAVEPHVSNANDGQIPAVIPTPLVDLPADEPVNHMAAAAMGQPENSGVASRPKASPSTRRQAAERGIDLATLTGTGPGGRILLSDLDAPAPPPTPNSQPAQMIDTAARSAPAPQPAPGVAPPTPVATPAAPGIVPLRGVRRAVAKNMTQSWSEIPHIHAFEHIDGTQLLDLRQRLRLTGLESYSQVTPLTFFVAAVARALVTHPQANASLNMVDETITTHGSVNVGVAVAAPQGLVVPVLQGAERLDFATLTVTLSQLVRGARAGELPREHFMGGTVTISNFGALGGEQAMPLIRPPEAMIVGFGSIAERPFVVDSQVVARSTMHTVVGADHRLLDGDITTAVLSTIGGLLSEPLQLVL